MLYYLLHQSPLWTGLGNGRRNVRILVICLFLYIILSYVAREYKGDNIIIKIFSKNFLFFALADIFVNAINYKVYYGRSIIHEINGTDENKEHIYVKNRHKYYNKGIIKDVILEEEINKELHSVSETTEKSDMSQSEIKKNKSVKKISKSLYCDLKSEYKENDEKSKPKENDEKSHESLKPEIKKGDLFEDINQEDLESNKSTLKQENRELKKKLDEMSSDHDNNIDTI